MNRIALTCAITLGFACLPRVAVAQPSEASRAAAVALFDDAKKLVAEGS